MKNQSYCKYIFHKEGFYKKSQKPEFGFEIQNSHICGTNSQQDIIVFNAPQMYIFDI